MLEGKVLITGGTGSLGNAIVKVATERKWDCDFTIFSRDEVKQSRMKSRYPEMRFILGDIQNTRDLDIACRGQDIVIHAAAYKQVPSSEVNALAAINTNVIGSLNVAMASVQAEVKRVIGISTDKACAPINLYGKTKATMESLFQQANSWGNTTFTLCRYGNVIGSRGSIIPLFRSQVNANKPLTITDTAMNRFWLTLTEAVHIIIIASEANAGTITVPKLKSMKIIDLAKLISPVGKIIDIGIRPGEKLDEHLIHRGESLHTCDRGNYYEVWPPYSGIKGSLPSGFEYRTDNCIGIISYDEMAAMITLSEAYNVY